MKHSFKYNTKLTLKKKFPQQLVLKRLLGIVPRVANQCTKISRGQKQMACSVHRGGRLAPAPGLSPPPEGRAGCTVRMPLPPEHPPSALPFLWPTSHLPFRWLSVHVYKFWKSFWPMEGEKGSSSSPTAPEGGRAGTTMLTACSLCIAVSAPQNKYQQAPTAKLWWRLPRKGWSEGWTWGTWWERARSPHTSQPPYRQPLGMLRSPRRKREGWPGETESVASSQADRGTHHWTSRNKMGQIISFFVFISFL